MPPGILVSVTHTVPHCYSALLSTGVAVPVIVAFSAVFGWVSSTRGGGLEKGRGGRRSKTE